MTLSVELYEVYVARVGREVDMAENRAYTEPSNILVVVTSTYHQPLFSRHVKLEARIRTTQYS